MKKLKIISLIIVSMLLILGACNTGNRKESNAIVINTEEMIQIASVDERFQSYNIEMVEIVGGEFWKPYKLMDSIPSYDVASDIDVSQKNDQMYRKLSPVNLTDKRLLTLAKGLAPAYVRVSGTWANAVYFQDNNEPIMKNAPEGFVNILTRDQWKGVVDFIIATDSKLITSFSVSKGVRDDNGIWAPEEAQKIVDYTKSLGGEIAAAELFNEPTIPSAGGEMPENYKSNNFAKDIDAFKKWAGNEVPDMLVLGPGSVIEGTPGLPLSMLGMNMLLTDSLMSAEPKPQFDVFSYHYYGAASMRIMSGGPFSITAENALTPAWLLKTDTVADYYSGIRDKYNPGKPLWITETAEAAGGGDPFAATYLDCFRYLYQLGSLAKKGVQVICHNTLAASEYSLIDQDTHLPKPNYWAAVLWNKMMGPEVYDAGKGVPGVYLFAHNLKDHPGGITLLIINTSLTSTAINIPFKAEQFTLTSDELQGTTVKLNGHELKLDADENLPLITGKKIKAGDLEIPSTSITFITIQDARLTTLDARRRVQVAGLGKAKNQPGK